MELTQYLCSQLGIPPIHETEDDEGEAFTLNKQKETILIIPAETPNSRVLEYIKKESIKESIKDSVKEITKENMEEIIRGS